MRSAKYAIPRHFSAPDGRGSGGKEAEEPLLVVDGSSISVEKGASGVLTGKDRGPDNIPARRRHGRFMVRSCFLPISYASPFATASWLVVNFDAIMPQCSVR